MEGQFEEKENAFYSPVPDVVHILRRKDHIGLCYPLLGKLGRHPLATSPS
jgi:hypothetical protein